MDAKSENELWAVVDKAGNVLYSRGGSSTTKKLLIYPTEAQARKVLNNPWIKQIIPNPKRVKVICIYEASLLHKEGE